MKSKTYALIAVVALFLGACSKPIIFPISQTVPSADIQMTVKTDKNKNYKIELNAQHMAGPERLSPPKNVYVVWAVNETGRSENLGRLVINKKRQARLETTTAFKPFYIVITAEEQGNVLVPDKQEVFRSQALSL